MFYFFPVNDSYLHLNSVLRISYNSSEEQAKSLILRRKIANERIENTKIASANGHKSFRVPILLSSTLSSKINNDGQLPVELFNSPTLQFL